MHPTGFPAFTIFAGIFAHAFPLGTVAWRIGFFSAIAMSGGAWFVWRCARVLGSDPWSALAGAWLFAFGSVAWTRGTRAEVHALAVFFTLGTLYFALVYLRDPAPRTLAAGMLCLGLGIATHPIVALLLPALLIVLSERLGSFTLRAIGAGALTFALGMSLYAYLPLRSAAVAAAHLDPVRSLGAPPGHAFWDNDHPSSRGGFMRELMGSEFGAGGALARMGKLDTYRRGVPGYLDTLLDELTPVGALLALTGFVLVWRRPDAVAVVLLAAFVVPTAFSLAYTVEADPRRYQLPGFAVASICAAVGASGFLQALRAPRAVYPAFALALAVLMLVLNRETFAQVSSYGAQAVIDSAVKNTPRNAVLIAPWIDATALAYGAYVEHALGRRIVDSAWLSDDAELVPAWSRKRPVFVVGTLFGQVNGFQAQKVAVDPDIYRIVRLPAPRHSSSP